MLGETLRWSGPESVVSFLRRVTVAFDVNVGDGMAGSHMNLGAERQ